MPTPAPALLPAPSADPPADLVAAIEALAEQLAAARRSLELLVGELPGGRGPSPAAASPDETCAADPATVVDDAYDDVPEALAGHLRRPAPADVERA